MQLCYFSFWRGGGFAALLRVGYGGQPFVIVPRLADEKVTTGKTGCGR